jgi:hypothetical protein
MRPERRVIQAEIGNRVVTGQFVPREIKTALQAPNAP